MGLVLGSIPRSTPTPPMYGNEAEEQGRLPSMGYGRNRGWYLPLTLLNSHRSAKAKRGSQATRAVLRRTGRLQVWLRCNPGLRHAMRCLPRRAVVKYRKEKHLELSDRQSTAKSSDVNFLGCLFILFLFLF